MFASNLADKDLLDLIAAPGMVVILISLWGVGSAVTPATAAPAAAEEKKEEEKEEEEEEEDIDMSGGGLFGDDDDDW